MSTPRRRLARRLLGFGAALGPALLPPAAALAQGPSSASSAPYGGRGTLYYGSYDRFIRIIDEATLTVRDSLPVRVGIPIGMNLSQDRSKLYVIDASFQKFEVFDLARRASLGTHTLNDGPLQVRIEGINVDPLDRYAILFVKTARKRPDRWEIGRPTLLRYDLAKRAVTDTVRWPNGQEREGVQILFSPDGKYMYFFTDEDILVYDATTLTQVDKWDLQRSVDDGLGNFGFGFPFSLYDESGISTGLFRTTDPVNRRTLMGVARVDLTNRTVDYYTLGPSDGVGFALAPGKRKAYGLKQQVGNYQFWVFDLENRRVERRVDFDGRPRMGLTVSSDGNQLYIHTAGATIDVYDAATLQPVRTATFRSDMTRVLVVPPAR